MCEGNDIEASLEEFEKEVKDSYLWKHRMYLLSLNECNRNLCLHGLYKLAKEEFHNEYK